MKSNKYFFLSALALLTACEKEVVTPQREAVRTETVAVHAENETKGAVDNSTGAFSWNSGSDQIAVWVGDSYTTCTVSGGEVSVELTGEQARSNYAIYPASSAIVDGYATPTLTYPTHYTVSGTGFDSQVPMVAVNTAGEELDFYQVGALVRIKIENAPVGTVSAIVSFKNTNVTGTATVSNPGTSSATATITDNAGKNVYFTLSPALSTVSTIYLDVPIPAVDYGTETITVKLFNDSDTWIYSEEKTWNSVARAHAKRISANVGSDGAVKANCIPGLFSVNEAGSTKLWFAKGNLYYSSGAYQIAANAYDATTSTYGLSDGSYHFQASEIFSDSPSKGSHSAYVSGVANLGSSWRLPLAVEYGRILGIASKNNRVVGLHYSFIQRNGDGNPKGLIIYPDGFNATDWNEETMGPMPKIDTKEWSSRKYTDSEITSMTRSGIAYLPVAGRYNNNDDTWYNWNTYGNYWTSTVASSTQGYRLTWYYTDDSLNDLAYDKKTDNAQYLTVRLAQNN
ncbi:MAG: hypothetical protein IJQ61_09205 [Bacteroidales bacterium]|nr:hypothetical protein [Bacteroidales bacterium]